MIKSKIIVKYIDWIQILVRYFITCLIVLFEIK